MSVQKLSDMLDQLNLPPGFRFHPTDKELIMEYLHKKIAGNQSRLSVIAEVDIYKFDPWQLPSKAIFGDKEWYFLSPRDKKYPNGAIKRVACSGFWKATGRDKIIRDQGKTIGFKKSLVFYVHEAPRTKEIKTNWIMHEYRLPELDHWVICKIYQKAAHAPKPIYDEVLQNNEEINVSSSPSSSQIDNMLDSFLETDLVPLAELLESTPHSVPTQHHMNNINVTVPNSAPLEQSYSSVNQMQWLSSESVNWGSFAGLDSTSELNPYPGPVQQYLINTDVNNQNGMLVPEVSPPLVPTPHLLNHNNGMNMSNDAGSFGLGGVEVDSWTQTQTQSQTQHVDNSGIIFNWNVDIHNFPDALEQFVEGYQNEPGSQNEQFH